MQFKQWLEGLTGPNSLPPIPGGFTRLTHFTSDRAANAVLQGQNFDYSKQGMIFSTADPHSNNQQVWETITSGKSGGTFERGAFGQAVVLIDLSRYETSVHNNMAFAPRHIENRKIVGVVYRQSMDFRPNPKYNPQGDQKVQAPQTRQMTQPVQSPQIPQPVQSPQNTQLPDIW